MVIAQLNVKFLGNRRGGQNLALHGYIYRVNRRGPDKVFWRCTIPECSVTMSTENNIPVIFGRQQHNHRDNAWDDTSREVVECLPHSTLRNHLYTDHAVNRHHLYQDP